MLQIHTSAQFAGFLYSNVHVHDVSLCLSNCTRFLKLQSIKPSAPWTKGFAWPYTFLFRIYNILYVFTDLYICIVSLHRTTYCIWLYGLFIYLRGYVLSPLFIYKLFVKRNLWWWRVCFFQKLFYKVPAIFSLAKHFNLDLMLNTVHMCKCICLSGRTLTYVFVQREITLFFKIIIYHVYILYSYIQYLNCSHIMNQLFAYLLSLICSDTYQNSWYYCMLLRYAVLCL